ncbi:MAG: hypothetical protein LBT77_01995 [Mycoplasmataceae bacterium]|jgi:hypothetical protein|nr:hypothetical protein [Mycoplasmataceae bacterium]
MPKRPSLVGQRFGLWDVVEKLSADKNGHILYRCKNFKNNNERVMSTNWLRKIQREKIIHLRKGRPRKWIITKIPYKNE